MVKNSISLVVINISSMLDSVVRILFPWMNILRPLSMRVKCGHQSTQLTNVGMTKIVDTCNSEAKFFFRIINDIIPLWSSSHPRVYYAARCRKHNTSVSLNSGGGYRIYITIEKEEFLVGQVQES